MKQNSRNFAILCLLLAAAGCKVNEEYDFEKGINTEVTVFSEGITLPLGTTKPIYLKDFLQNEEGESIIESTDEGYVINISDEIDLSENIPDLKSEMPSIDDIPPVNSDFQYHIGKIDVSDFRIDGSTLLDLTYSTSEDYNIDVLESVDVDESKTWNAGLNEYSSTLSSSTFALPSCTTTVGSFISDDAVQWVDMLPGDNVIDIPDELVLDAAINDNWSVTCNVEFDEIIKGIKSIRLSQDSKLKIEVTLKNPVISAGTITTDAVLDVSSLLKISGVSGPIDMRDLVLSPETEKPYSFTKEYNVESVVIDDKDWNPATHSLNMSRSVSMNGVFFFSGLKTSKSVFKAAMAKGDMCFDIKISFNGFQIADAEVALNEINTDQQENINVPIPEIELPEAVTSVDWVKFDKTRDLVLTATAGNIPSGLKFVIDKLSMEFPSCISVDGAVNGVIEYTGIDISAAPGQSVSKSIHLDKIVFPQPVSGKINFSDKIKVQAVAHACTADGKYISFASLPKNEKDDMSLAFSLKGSLAVGDFLIHVDNSEDFSYSEPFEMELPSDCKDFGDFTVTTKGSPKLRIEMSAPDLFAEGAGVKINLPEFLNITDLSTDSYHTFDAQKNIITFNKGTFPSNVTLAVNSLDMKPVEDGGKYMIKGEIAFNSPELIPQSGEVTKSLLDKFTSKDIKLKATIDTIEPDEVQLTKFDIPVDEQTFTLDLIGEGDVPAELKSVDNIVLESPITLDLSLATTGLPVLAGGKHFHVALDVTFPDFLVIESADAHNHLKLEGDIVDGKLALKVKILTLNLKGTDLSKGLSGDITVSGKVSADNPQVELASLSEDIDVKFTGTVSSVSLKSAEAYVDYKIETIRYPVDLSELPDILDSEDAVIDIVNPSLALNIGSNMGIPVTGELVLQSYKDNKVIKDAKISLDDIFPYSKNPEEFKNARIYLARYATDCPEGYSWKMLNLADLIRTIPDSLVVCVDLNIDKEKPCCLDMDADYKLNLAYDFTVPLEFGSDFYVAVTDTLKVEGIGDLLKNAVVGLGIEATNSIPLNLGVSIEFLDGKGNVVPSMYPVCGEIKAGDKDGKPVVSAFEISTETADGADPGSITSLLFTVAIKGAPDYSRNVSDKDFAALKLIASLPEGFTYKFETEEK